LSPPTTEISDHEQTNLQNTRNTNAGGDSVKEASATAGIAARRMGGSMFGKMVKPGVDQGVRNTGTEGGGET